MKLAEALVLRADVQRRIEQLRANVKQSALVQEGEQPPEDPQALLSQLDGLFDQLTDLIIRINKTNMLTVMPGGGIMTEALAQRDVLSLRYRIISELANTAADRTDRYGRSEIRKIATVDVAVLREQATDLARQRRELDTAIQALNWATDLAE